MEYLNDIIYGFSVASTSANLLWCFLGVFIGTLAGVLPGVGPLATISILLPLILKIPDPTTGIILLAGIYYGTQYGGSITSILMNIPGEASSAVTCIDGYQMTRKGKAGAALSITALSSFFAGTIATFIIIFLAKPLANIAYLFGPIEYTVLMLLGLVAAVSLNQGSTLKGIAMVLIGILLGMVGADVNSGIVRFTFNIKELSDGISFGIIAMGIFGLGEIVYNYFHKELVKLIKTNLSLSLHLTKNEIKESMVPIIRGTAIGSILGLLPGGGTIISSFASYSVEKYFSKNPQQFGKGAIAGVAGPESANNAAAQTSLVPMLILGLPVTPVMSLCLAVLMIYGITPGPQIITQQANLFWGLIASMYIGNFFLLLLNLPLVGIWISILKIPRKILYSIVLLACVTGAYFLNNSWFDVLLLVPFAILGYIFRLLGCEPAPMAMGFVVGALFEEYLRRSLAISRGDWYIFLEKPISLTLILFFFIIFFSKMLHTYMQHKKQETK
jgi:putative tricarboxylic transport membrane protein